MTRIHRAGWGLGLLAALLWALTQTGWGQRPVWNPGGLPQAFQFVSASWQPDLSADFLAVIVRATGITFAYAVCGTTLSLLLGFIGGILTADIWWQTLLGHPRYPLGLRGLLAVPRAIHELIWGLFFINLFGLDPLVAVLAIALPFGATVAKVFADILDETDPKPLQTLLSAGARPLSAFCYGLLPQALPNLFSYSFYRFECSLRSAAVLGIIGAGGLGYEIFLSLQSLRYEQLWTGFYALMLLNGCVDAWSAWVRRRLGFVGRLAIGRKGENQSGGLARQYFLSDADPKFKINSLFLSWLILALTIPLCFHALDLDWSQLWAAETGGRLRDVLQAAVPSAIALAQLWELGRLSLQTLAMSILAIAVATSGGLLFSVLVIRLPGGELSLAGRLRAGLGRLCLLLSRAIPAPIWALVFLFVTFPGILPGAMALGIHNFGILGRLMAEANENLDERPLQALLVLGATGPQQVLYGLLPANLPQFIAYSLYRWEVCLRETVIVGLVGAGGLGRLMTEQLSSFDYAGLTMTLAAFGLLTWLVDGMSRAMRTGLR
ncbi:MAG: ABC transporter permease subunit [Leptolyngbya sp. SIO4C1]|nr:ABC transporter permease subunit [Leptolyngbya sp. SIO4C1]